VDFWDLMFQVNQEILNIKWKIDSKFYNIIRIACISITISTFCMWLMWICTYMHQMYPLIVPVLEHGGH
jgi:hypothetical protein